MAGIKLLLTLLVSFLQQASAVELSELYPYGIANGDRLLNPGNDVLDAVYLLNLPVDLPFFAIKNITRAHVTTKGYIHFKSDDGLVYVSWSPTMFPIRELGFNIVAGYWYDLMFRSYSQLWARATTTDQVLLDKLSVDARKAFNLTSFQGKMALLVSVIGASQFEAPYPGSPETTFQTAIVTNGVATFVFFLYVSLPSKQTMNKPGIAGYNDADGSNYYALPGSLSKESQLILNTTNINGFPPGKWALPLVDESLFRSQPLKYCEGKVDGTYPLPTTCSKYVICSGGKAILIDDCNSSNLTMHPYYRVCVWNTQHSCIPDDPANFCKNRADGNYRDPLRCNGFVTCANQLTHRTMCNPPILYYNPAIDACDWPSRVDCKPT